MVHMAITINGQEALNMGEATQYVSLTYPALNARIKVYNRMYPDAKIVKSREPGGREVYIRKSDLDKIRVLQPIQE